MVRISHTIEDELRLEVPALERCRWGSEYQEVVAGRFVVSVCHSVLVVLTIPGSAFVRTHSSIPHSLPKAATSLCVRKHLAFGCCYAVPVACPAFLQFDA